MNAVGGDPLPVADLPRLDELVQARRFEMCVLSAHLRMLLDEFGSANLDPEFIHTGRGPI